MKRIVLFVGIAVAAVATLVALQGQHFEEGRRSDTTTARFSIGTPDNPAAREEYWRKRLMDPTTGAIPADMRERELAFADELPKKGYLSKTEAASWTQRGPNNVGGRTRALAIDKTNEMRIIAGGVSGGMFRSEDGGASWIFATTPSDLHSVTALAQDTSGGQNTWYAGSGELSGNSARGFGNPTPGFDASFRGDGLFKSTDAGVTWAQLGATVSGTPETTDFFDFINEVAVDPSNAVNDEVYVAAWEVIWRSLDGGTSFSAVLNPGTVFLSWSDVVVTATGVVYAAFEEFGNLAGVYRSTSGDAGSFADLSAPFTAGYGRVELAISQSNENEIWALVYSPGATTTAGHELWKYEYISGDGTGTGGKWRDFSAFIPVRGMATGTFDSQGAYDLVVDVHPTMGNFVFIGGTNLFRIDTTGTAGMAASGDTWIGGYTSANNSFALYEGPNMVRQHPDQHAIAFTPAPFTAPQAGDPNVMYVGSDGGIHRTDNSLAAGDGMVNWTSLNTGYLTTQFYTVCQNSDPTDLFAGGGMQDNGTWGTTSSSPSVDWTEDFGGDGSHCQIVNKSTGTNTLRYVSAQEGFLVRSEYTSGGTLLGQVLIDPGVFTLAARPADFLFIAPFIADPVDEKILYMLESATIWRAANGETADSLAWLNMAPPGIIGDNTTALAASTAPVVSTLYFGTDGCKLYSILGANTSAAGAAAADITPPGLAGLTCTVSDIGVNPANDQEVLMAISNYQTPSLFHTTDGGTSWTDVEGGLAGVSGPSVRSVAIVPGATDPYLAATSTGLYSSPTMAGGGTIWTQEGPTVIGNVVIDMVRGRAVDGNVLAGTHANGIYSSLVFLNVELSSIEAVGDGDGIDVRWETASETDNAGFDVEYRVAGAETFVRHGFVPGHGTRSESASYSYRIDNIVPARYEVRLRQIDTDGSQTYSSTVAAAISLPGEFVVTEAYPNPFGGEASFDLVVRGEQHVQVTVYDVAGRIRSTIMDEVMAADSPRRLIVDASKLPSGLYFCRIQGERFEATMSLVVAK